MEWKLENLLGYFTTHSFLFDLGNDLVKQGNSVHLAADSWYFSSRLAHWPTLLNSSYFKYTCSCSFLYLLTTQSIYFCLIPCPIASVRKSIKKFPPTQQLRMSDCQNSCIHMHRPMHTGTIPRSIAAGPSDLSSMHMHTAVCSEFTAQYGNPQSCNIYPIIASLSTFVLTPAALLSTMSTYHYPVHYSQIL